MMPAAPRQPGGAARHHRAAPSYHWYGGFANIFAPLLLAWRPLIILLLSLAAADTDCPLRARAAATSRQWWICTSLKSPPRPQSRKKKPYESSLAQPAGRRNLRAMTPPPHSIVSWGAKRPQKLSFWTIPMRATAARVPVTYVALRGLCAGASSGTCCRCGMITGETRQERQQARWQWATLFRGRCRGRA